MKWIYKNTTPFFTNGRNVLDGNQDNEITITNFLYYKRTHFIFIKITMRDIIIKPKLQARAERPIHRHSTAGRSRPRQKQHKMFRGSRSRATVAPGPTRNLMKSSKSDRIQAPAATTGRNRQIVVCYTRWPCTTEKQKILILIDHTIAILYTKDKKIETYPSARTVKSTVSAHALRR